jgi:hypothetical protein
MTERCQAIVLCLVGVAKAHGRKYCWPSQKRIQELVEKYEKLGFSMRTLNRDLRWLEDNGYISRSRRIRVGPDGKLIFCSTLYKFKGKVFNFLYSLGNAVKSVFSFFRVPKWADYQLTQKQVSSSKPASSVEYLLIKERDGTVSRYNPRTGEYVR